MNDWRKGARAQWRKKVMKKCEGEDPEERFLAFGVYGYIIGSLLIDSRACSSLMLA